MPPSSKYQKNSDGKTPQVLFTDNHKKLREKGEKWVKHTAAQSMLVAALIATVTFTTAFTVPGGYDRDYFHHSHNQKKHIVVLLGKTTLFQVVLISGALALFSSSTSVLMFLSILTSRYAENDFLKSLPNKLIIGFVALFLSIAAMTVSFSASLLLYFKYNTFLVYNMLFIFSLVPLLYLYLIYPLLKDLYSSTYSYRYRFQPTHRLIRKRFSRQREVKLQASPFKTH